MTPLERVQRRIEQLTVPRGDHSPLVPASRLRRRDPIRQGPKVHIRHSELIDTIVDTNDGVRSGGFWVDMPKYLATTWTGHTIWCEHLRDGETFSCQCPDDDESGQEHPFSGDPRGMREKILCAIDKRIPDAYQIHDDLDLIVVWEVANFQSHKKAVDKWTDFVHLLDMTGDIGFAVVVCDSSGICTIPYLEFFPNEGVASLAWRASDPIPIDWYAQAHRKYT